MLLALSQHQRDVSCEQVYLLYRLVLDEIGGYFLQQLRPVFAGRNTVSDKLGKLTPADTPHLVAASCNGPSDKTGVLLGVKLFTDDTLGSLCDQCGCFVAQCLAGLAHLSIYLRVGLGNDILS